MSCGRPVGGEDARVARRRGRRPVLLSSFPLLLFPFSSSIDRRRPILAVPPGSGRSAYRSIAGLVRFVVMGNMFRTELRIHRRYDLKGSSHGRSTSKHNINENATLKDLDLSYVFNLEKSWRESLFREEEEVEHRREERWKVEEEKEDEYLGWCWWVNIILYELVQAGCRTMLPVNIDFPRTTMGVL
ncbi:hypothetical protein BHM03_00056369 [Ensete ventricosum]|nr:hypothetical protein BHM03_00056369 [Ensete ventricosum]